MFAIIQSGEGILGTGFTKNIAYVSAGMLTGAPSGNGLPMVNTKNYNSVPNAEMFITDDVELMLDHDSKALTYFYEYRGKTQDYDEGTTTYWFLVKDEMYGVEESGDESRIVDQSHQTVDHDFLSHLKQSVTDDLRSN